MTVGPDGPICPRSDLPTAWCGHCRQQEAVPGQLGLTFTEDHGPVFTAQYPGTCAVCDGFIKPDTQIARLRRGGGYACEDCLS
jgi:hypothetical protein